MNKMFYPRLAATNIGKNSKTYIPYLITCIMTVMSFYIVYSLSVNQALNSGELFGNDSLAYIMSLGNIVIAIFAVIFLFYTNSFLIKRRKKEFGLYNILGMEKKHISKILFFETLYIALISVTLGIGSGMLLSKLIFLIILKVLGVNGHFVFEISYPAIIATLILFGIIFLLILLNDLRQIHLAKPIDLIKGGVTGEKEPKSKWLLAIIGVICLAIGYYIALTTKNPLQALALFFVAVVLVIIGTYCLFTAGSITFLKLLRKNKKYYYKTNHFISVSGLIYRMKQNAVGLANICILSTMTLVMIAATTALYSGTEDVIHSQYIRSITISSWIDDTHNDIENTHAIVDELLAKTNLQKTNELDYNYLTFSGAELNKNQVSLKQREQETDLDNSHIVSIHAMTLSGFNQISDNTAELQPDEILIYSNSTPYEYDTLSIENMNFKVKTIIKNPFDKTSSTISITDNYYIIVKDDGVLNDLFELQKEFYNPEDSSENYVNLNYINFYGFDFAEGTSEEDIKAYYAELADVLPASEKFSGFLDNLEDNRDSIYGLYGGFFFLGIFLGILFIMATILIIYYKQISEGFEDRHRFEIMQKVGMSRKEIKKSIHSQVLTVFFLPLITAGIHTAFSFNIVRQLLLVLGITNTSLLILSTVICFAIFALFYILVYTITARIYYKTVSI